MISAILGVVIAMCIVLFIILSKKRIMGDDMAIAGCIVGVSYLIAMVFIIRLGYLEPDHGNKTIDQVSTYQEAVEWNEEEQRYNNYFFRFSLREEHLVDLSKFEVSENVQERFG